jgi:UDP-N-acetylmuramoylalanine-D-glutamate ligase
MAMSTTNNPSALQPALAGGQLVDARRRHLDQEQGGAHRMEPVLEVRGVLYINDSAFHLPRCHAGLHRPQIDRRVVWITGACER